MGRESSPLVKLLWICANRRYLNSFRNSGYSVIIFGFQPDTFSVFALCTFQLGKIKSSRHRRGDQEGIARSRRRRKKSIQRKCVFRVLKKA
jgi:hypothetical protein